MAIQNDDDARKLLIYIPLEESDKLYSTKDILNKNNQVLKYLIDRGGTGGSTGTVDMNAVQNLLTSYATTDYVTNKVSWLDSKTAQSLAKQYTKTDVDGKFLDYYNKAYLDNAFNNYYNKADVDSKFSNLSNLYYTQSAVNNRFSGYYNKADIDTKLNNINPDSDNLYKFKGNIAENTSLDNYKDQGVYQLAWGTSNVTSMPCPLPAWGNIFNIGKGSLTQYASFNDNLYVRFYAGSPLTWSAWQQLNNVKGQMQPTLDSLKQDILAQVDQKINDNNKGILRINSDAISGSFNDYHKIGYYNTSGSNLVNSPVSNAQNSTLIVFPKTSGDLNPGPNGECIQVLYASDNTTWTRYYSGSWSNWSKIN